MDLNLVDVSTGAIAVVPIITLLVQALKMTNIKGVQRYAPLISIGLGVIIGLIANHNTADLSNTILTGVMYGLSASGLYSGVKTTTQAVNNKGDGTTSGTDNTTK